MRRICVFCGSSPGATREYVEAARLLGTELARRRVTLVYGGAQVGVMGALAQSCLDAGGEVIGVITRRLADEGLAQRDITTLHVVESMHERKAKMFSCADGFIGLPGGLGTLEEFFEVLTWAQLGQHRRPCGLLNSCGYFDRLLAFLDNAVEQQFLEPEHRRMIQVDVSPAGLLDMLADYEPPRAEKAAWVLQMTREAGG